MYSTIVKKAHASRDHVRTELNCPRGRQHLSKKKKKKKKFIFAISTSLTLILRQTAYCGCLLSHSSHHYDCLSTSFTYRFPRLATSARSATMAVSARSPLTSPFPFAPRSCTCTSSEFNPTLL